MGGFGAWDAINMDGGGSTAMYMADCAGNPLALGKSSDFAGLGRERYCGSHFGVYAKPLSGFFNDIQILPGDTTTTITWTTPQPSTAQIQFGTTPSYGNLSASNGSPVTKHVMTLNGLSANTTNYFRINAIANGRLSGLSCARTLF